MASSSVSAPAPRSAAPPLSLSGIRAVVEDELEIFQDHFREAMRTPVPLLDKIARYIWTRKGKQFRPMLVLLTAKVCGGVTERSYTAATMAELLHTATLVHDDVVDDAERRRGVFSINALWKNKAAVLFGDFLLSRGMLLALDRQEYALLHALSDAIRRMIEGEMLQLEKTRHLDLDEATYFDIISGKTASLIAACTRCGALSASDDPDLADRMGQMGEKLGLAFQIRDDLFDYGDTDVGKPLGIDLKEKKLTLPLIHALRTADRSEQRRIMKIVKKKRKRRSDVREVATFVRDHGGLAYARAEMLRLADEARALLEPLPPSDARDALLDLVAFTVKRTT